MLILNKRRNLIFFLFNCGGFHRMVVDIVHQLSALRSNLRSKNCYRELRTMLALPDSSIFRSYFGKIVTPGSDVECQHVINSVSEKLGSIQKFCKILLGKIHIKPAIRYVSNQIIGFLLD